MSLKRDNGSHLAFEFCLSLDKKNNRKPSLNLNDIDNKKNELEINQIKIPSDRSNIDQTEKNDLLSSNHKVKNMMNSKQNTE